MRTWQRRLPHCSRTWKGSCGSILCTIEIDQYPSFTFFVHYINLSQRSGLQLVSPLDLGCAGADAAHEGCNWLGSACAPDAMMLTH